VVTHLIPHVGEALALGDEQARVRVAEVVDANLPQLGLREELGPDAARKLSGSRPLLASFVKTQAGTFFHPFFNVAAFCEVNSQAICRQHREDSARSAVLHEPRARVPRVEALRPPLVSVLMPTYNRARFVIEAVRSVLDQSYEALELVVVDDGSTDETRDVLAAVHDARLRMVATPHRGIGAALNAGLAIASGDFVARLDSDDIWSRTMLADQLSALTARPDVDVVYARSEVIDERGDRKYEYWGQPLRFPDDPLLSLLYVDPVCIPCGPPPASSGS
jgi:hypothetical protein